MLIKSMNLEFYLNRFNGRPSIISIPPSPNLACVIVIPCYCEPDWEITLQSIFQCKPTTAPIEILIVVNDSEGDEPAIHSEQEKALGAIRDWALHNQTNKLQFHVLDALRLPKKHAGVGLARKIGMDEALHRLKAARNLDNGFIVGLDAYCICQPNYLTALESHFRKHPHTPGCSIHFEHPLDGDFDPEIYETAARYELHLRYYVEALRYAGFPHAFHTIGSSMAARATDYMAQGGMNRRKAGEDFYFLNKMIPLGKFTELTSTTVHPSPRTSDRVPFGTGRAIAKHYGQSTFPTYSWKSILELRTFFKVVKTHDPFKDPAKPLPETEQLPPFMVDYLHATNGWTNWKKCIAGTTDFNAYKHSFFRWFDGFQCMKSMHHMRDTFHVESDVRKASQQLLESIEICNDNPLPCDTKGLLNILRNHQRKGWSAN